MDPLKELSGVLFSPLFALTFDPIFFKIKMSK